MKNEVLKNGILISHHFKSIGWFSNFVSVNRVRDWVGSNIATRYYSELPQSLVSTLITTILEKNYGFLKILKSNITSMDIRIICFN